MEKTDYINLLKITERLFAEVISNPKEQLQGLQGLKNKIEPYITTVINAIGQEPLNGLNGFFYRDYTDFKQKARYPNIEMLKAFDVALKDLNVKNGVSECNLFNAEACINHIWGVLYTQLGQAPQLNEAGMLVLLYIAVSNEIKIIETVTELKEFNADSSNSRELTKVLHKAIGAGYCTCKNEGYKWNRTNGELAIFADMANNKGYTGTKFADVEKLFETNMLAQALYRVTGQKNYDKYKEEIKKLFD